MRTSPMIVAAHVGSGVAALNVVTAALDADPRTAGADVRFARDPAQIAAALDEAATAERPALVAWSFYSPDFEARARDLVDVRARTRAPALHVAGGVHATAEPRATLDAGFDRVVVGEGEAPMIELVDALAEGRDERATPGLGYLDGGRLALRGPGPRRPLDAYPAFNVRYGKWNAIEITRGCVYACTFCQTPYAFKARFRHRSVESVRAHLEAIRDGRPRFVRFVTPTSLSYGSDDTSVNLPAVEALLTGVREALGPGGKVYFGTFPSEIRPEHVTREALALLARLVDNRGLVLGGQSGSERILAETRRGHTVADVVRAVELSVEAGFTPSVDLLLGLPGETADDRRASLELARRLVRMGAKIHSHAFMPLPGTPLRDSIPEAIEPEVARELEHLESAGAAYGQWRKQLVSAARLVRAREGRRGASGRGHPTGE